MDPRIYFGLVVGLIIGWFAIGIIYNLRRGDSILRWMRAGLPKIGERSTLRWLGTSVAELVIAKARSPFRQVEMLIVLAPRDVPWMWLITHYQGRRDTLILRGQLEKPPLVDLELADPTFWTGRQSLREAEKRGWSSRPADGRQLMAPPGELEQAGARASELESTLNELAPHFWRLSLRRDPAQMIVHLPLPRREQDAAAYFTTIRALAKSVSE